MTAPITRRLWPWLLLACAWLAMPAWAQVQARVDRNPVDLGDSFVLSVESAQAVASPDLTPLMEDFELLDQSSSRSMQMGTGGNRSSTVYRLTLEPKRAGALTIPALQFGTQSTSPIALTVRPAPPAPGRDAGADIFLETEVDDNAPYVQQSVGVVLRLYYAVPLLSGELDLESPDGALLQKIGDDVQGSREINGRRYNLVERRFLLVPERSGALVIPAPRFRGRGAGGWFDDLMGGNGRELRAAGPSRPLAVRAQPGNAPQPWLPLRDLRLRYVGAPATARAGEAATLIVEGVALGATQAQLPAIAPPSAAGAQVFAEPVQYDESFVGATPQVKWTQRYSVVPDGPGDLVVSGLQIPWWDVAAGEARLARLPDQRWRVAPATASTAANPVLPATGASAAASPAYDERGLSLLGAQTPARPWMWLAVGFAVLWLITLLWALRRRHAPAPSAPAATGGHAGAPRTQADLKRALDTGSLDDVAEVLRGMAAPPARDLDALVGRLQLAQQRDAVEALRRACWAGGDGVAARQALRAAFAQGPRWAAAAAEPTAPLPPLYPQR